MNKKIAIVFVVVWVATGILVLSKFPLGSYKDFILYGGVILGTVGLQKLFLVKTFFGALGPLREQRALFCFISIFYFNYLVLHQLTKLM